MMAKMKNLLGTVGLAAAATLATASGAVAEEREFAWSITVGGTSDYVFRGISLTEENPAFQASVDFSYGIAYLGFWGSNIDGDGFEPWELDIYGGIKPVWGDTTFDFGVIGYLYPDADPGLHYYEFKAGASRELVKNLTAGVILYYTPDQDNYNETWTVEGSLAYTLPQMHIFTPTVSGGVGYSEDRDEGGIFLGEDDYVYWNVGLALGVEKFTLDFRYWDTNISDVPGVLGEDLADERFVFTMKATLP